MFRPVAKEAEGKHVSHLFLHLRSQQNSSKPNEQVPVEMLKITLITPQHVTTVFFFFGCKLANSKLAAKPQANQAKVPNQAKKKKVHKSQKKVVVCE